MGILNVTPDSFSDGGQYEDLPRALTAAHKMIDAGAMIIDVGGESTRPGAKNIDAYTEQSRVLPIIEALACNTDCLISIDTYHAETARLAVAAGAHIINDVWGLQREPDLATIAAETGAGLVIMHTGRDRVCKKDVIADQFAFLETSLEIARQAKVKENQILLDPGFGFAKEVDDNIALMARFAELQKLGFPILVGTSRKRFIGVLTGQETVNRDIGTAATSVILRLSGADIFRVHNVAINRNALAVADALLSDAQYGQRKGYK